MWIYLDCNYYEHPWSSSLTGKAVEDEGGSLQGELEENLITTPQVTGSSPVYS